MPEVLPSGEDAKEHFQRIRTGTGEALDGLRKEIAFSKTVESGDTVTGLLGEYFEKQSDIQKDGVDKRKQIYESLRKIRSQNDANGEKINPNRLHIGWQATIENGVFIMLDSKGEKQWSAVLSDDATGKPDETNEKLHQVPEVRYDFERGLYRTDEKMGLEEAKAAIREHYEKSDEDNDFIIKLKGTADKSYFGVDKRVKTKRIYLSRKPEWRADYKHALQSLQELGLPELSGMDFARDDIEAIHALSFRDQQIVMNHAIALLRAEQLRDDLRTAFPEKNVRFEISTEWKKDPDTRIATLIDLDYRPKQKEDVPKPVKPLEPEKPEEALPLTPDEIIHAIETMENDEYEVAGKATIRSTGIFNSTDEWVAPTLNNKKTGQNIQYYFLRSKSHPENPKYYIAVNPNNPTEIAIGKTEYTDVFFVKNGNFGPFEKVVPIDQSERDKTLASVRSVFDNLPN